MEQKNFGIYLNTKELKVARINSPYWIPSGSDWVLLTPEVNMTLLKIREVAKEKKLVSEPDKLVWI
jgi:cellobiose-specific phosphotransferase system component IIB